MIEISREPPGFAAFIDGAESDALYLRPIIARKGNILSSAFLPFLGGVASFAHVELIRRGTDGRGKALVVSAEVFVSMARWAGIASARSSRLASDPSLIRPKPLGGSDA